MTANQINYQKYLEDIRSHLANEDISRRQASAAERQAASGELQAEAAAYNAETNRKNSLINESAVGAQWYGAQANAAYQQAMAAVSQAQQQEAVRHNKTSEANDLIKSGRETTAKNYATQVTKENKEAEIAEKWKEAVLNAAVTGGGKVLDTITRVGSLLLTGG